MIHIPCMSYEYASTYPTSVLASRLTHDFHWVILTPARLFDCSEYQRISHHVTHYLPCGASAMQLGHTELFWQKHPSEANGYTELPLQQSTNAATTQHERKNQMPLARSILRRMEYDPSSMIFKWGVIDMPIFLYAGICLYAVGGY